MQRNYLPIIKTTDSEIKAYEKLSDETKSDILPLFELTRSRPIKGYPDGDIHRRMKQLVEFTKGNPIILDLTSHEDLMNDQIEDLFDDSYGFQEWRSFIDRYNNEMNIIPALHVYDDNLDASIELAKYFNHKGYDIAYRIGPDVEPADFRRYMQALNGVVNFKEKFFLIVDCEYVDHLNLNQKISALLGLLNVAYEFKIGKISVNSSSFPPAVTKHPQGRDHQGQLDMLELQIFNASKLSSENNDVQLFYGDYASVHPMRYNIRGGGWVPRIDLSLDASYIYKRFRREEGGYKLAAIEMIAWDQYSPIDCWGTKQIEKAANGDPPGKSPAFWISVRINQHITRFSALANDYIVL